MLLASRSALRGRDKSVVRSRFSWDFAPAHSGGLGFIVNSKDFADRPSCDCLPVGIAEHHIFEFVHHWVSLQKLINEPDFYRLTLFSAICIGLLAFPDLGGGGFPPV
jgi:hypothetical protein